VQSNYHEQLDDIKDVVKTCTDGLAVEFMTIQRKHDDHSIWHECIVCVLLSGS
jgi:hypothetical protein